MLANHRWGRHGEEQAAEELARLRELYSVAELSPEQVEIVQQIVGLEICNWNLERSFLDLCGAIGSGQPHHRPIGHMGWLSPERWNRIWAYYASIRDWLSPRNKNAYRPLLAICDPEGDVRARVEELLGERTELKELYAERLALCIKWHLDECPGAGPEDPEALVRSHRAAVEAVEAAVRERTPDDDILERAYRFEGNGTLNLCHHKLFRRWDIILSSIGGGGWRKAMPEIGTTGFNRAETLERRLAPLRAWLDGAEPGTDLGHEVHAALGEADSEKRFLASLLESLLRAQQVSARGRAQARDKASR